MSQRNPLEMSDEEFLNQGLPSAEPQNKEPSAQEPAAQEETPVEETAEEASQEPAQTEEEDTQTQEPEGEGDAADVPEVPAEGSESPTDKPGAEAKPDPVSKPDGAAEAEKKAEENQPQGEKPDYEKFYHQVMQPIKANGKTIELKSPEEAIRLMQMGAGFTKKLQDLQPVLKTVRMLEKADLLDEGKLSYLIDIHNKNPEAIKKLIKESGIDPLDLNPNDNIAYTPGNHSVSDGEMAFNEALNEVLSQEGGKETIDTINQTWDQKSIQILWENPDIFGVIQSQRKEGYYPLIVAEIDRQKSLGRIPPTTPFLHAYKQVGDALAAAGAFNHLTQAAPQGSPQTASPPAPAQSPETQKPQPQVIATRTGRPKAQVKNGDKAQAAAPTQSTPRKAAPVTNPLAMADDEFLKQFAGRL